MKAAVRRAHQVAVTLFIPLCVLAVSPALAGKSDNTLVVAFPNEVTTLEGLYSRPLDNDVPGLLTDDALCCVGCDDARAQTSEVQQAAKSNRIDVPPIETPAINQKTARALGLDLPASMLKKADRVVA